MTERKRAFLAEVGGELAVEKQARLIVAQSLAEKIHSTIPGTRTVRTGVYVISPEEDGAATVIETEDFTTAGFTRFYSRRI